MKRGLIFCTYCADMFKVYSPEGEGLDLETQLQPIVAQMSATAKAIGRDDDSDELEQVCDQHR